MTAYPARQYFDLIGDLEHPCFAGGIFPREMAFFPHSCDRAGIAEIIEPGKGTVTKLPHQGEGCDVPVRGSGGF